ncbi:MAG: hypothetical protein WBQ66_18415, partial [Blastocatellia bacterium]
VNDARPQSYWRCDGFCGPSKKPRDVLVGAQVGEIRRLALGHAGLGNDQIVAVEGAKSVQGEKFFAVSRHSGTYE